jgi:hypothetical protein
VIDATLGGTKMRELVLRSLTRPIRMFFEPLVLFTDIFLSYQYGIFFLFFEAYPVIFGGELAEQYAVKQVL